MQNDVKTPAALGATRCLMAACALCAAAVGTRAQSSGAPALPLGPHMHVGEPFSDRALTIVYNATLDQCPSSTFALGSSSSYVLDDIGFEPGPWGAAFGGARNISRLAYAFQSSGWTSTPIDTLTGTHQLRISHVFEFYEPGNFTASPMLGAQAPFAVRVIPTNFGSGFVWNFTADLNPVVSVGTRTSVWVAIKAIDPQSGVRLGCSQPAGETGVTYSAIAGRVGPVCTGSSDVRDARDTGCDDGFHSPSDLFGAGADPATARHLSLGLWGDVPITPPPPEPLCPVNDGMTARTFTPAAGPSVKWYSLCIGPVTDASLRYLNVDTEGSSQGASLALFSDHGTLLARDDGSGSGNNSQLTFGVGRTAAVGDGAQYDGRDGELAAGTYYLAVAGPGTQFSEGYTTVASPMTATQVQLHVQTNFNAGGSLLPVVPPPANHADFTASGPPWTFPESDALQGTTHAGLPNPGADAGASVLWSRFTIAAPGATNLTTDSTYLDIDAGDSDYADNVLYLFNSAGDLVAFSDDQVNGLNWLPVLSFGASNPARSSDLGHTRGAANATGTTWTGRDGELPAGTYYIASAAWPTDVLTGHSGSTPTLGTGRRFHVRGLSGSNAPQTINFYTGHGFNCDPVDFNNDGLFPDTLDIDDFLVVFSGGQCSNDPFCADIDFNNDGLFPDTMDIDAFLNVFSGGQCMR